MPNQYFLKPILENYKNDIIFNFNEIKVQIDECSNDQIKMVDKNGCPFCENPVCEESCPVGISAKCVPASSIVNINDKTKNICECYLGWQGTDCDIKLFVNFR